MCWYDAIKLSPLNGPQCELGEIYCYWSYLLWIDLQCKLGEVYTGSTEKELSQCESINPRPYMQLGLTYETTPTS